MKKKLQEILICIYAPGPPWGFSLRSRIDVEFWRDKHNYKIYQDISSSQFKRLCNSLMNEKTNTIETQTDSIIIEYRIRP